MKNTAICERSRAALLALLSVAPFSSSAAAQIVFDDPVRAVERERALGIARVHVAPNTVEYALPKDLVTPEVIEKNGALIVYEGQQAFTLRGLPAAPRLIRLTDDRGQSAADDILGTVRIDAYGRRWRTVDIDAANLRRAIERYDALVAEEFGIEPGAVETDPFDATPRGSDPEETEYAVWYPASWTRTDCDSDGADDIFRWDADDRSPAATPMSTRQAKIVKITTARGSGSGVMVDSNTVLTAAHVVCWSGGSPVLVSSIDVMTYGNYQSGAQAFAATALTLPGGYTGDGDFSDDYALIDISSSAGVGWMAISQASNSTIEAADAYNGGYPGDGPSCSSTWRSPVVSGFAASTQYWSNGELFGTTSKRVKTRVDVSTGHSGGPFYYYPSGCCGSHFVTGVAAGHVNLLVGSDYNGGPKGSAIRSWVVANM